MDAYKWIVTLIGAAGSAVAGVFGGWSMSIETLCAFMIIDYVTGLVVAGIFKNSQKTETGALESRAGFKGLIRKCMILVMVFMAHRLDIEIGASYIRDGVCIAFILNEAVSIIENAGLMGLKIPQQITDAIDLLKQKTDQEEESK